MRDRGWFHADHNDLGVDPLPYKRKWMTIEYTAQGKYAVLKVREKSTVGPVRMMEAAGMDVSGNPLRSAASASSATATAIVVDDDDAPAVETRAGRAGLRGQFAVNAPRSGAPAAMRTKLDVTAIAIGVLAAAALAGTALVSVGRAHQSGTATRRPPPCRRWP